MSFHNFLLPKNHTDSFVFDSFVCLCLVYSLKACRTTDEAFLTDIRLSSKERSSGATAVFSTIYDNGNRCFVANVGDSEGVICKGGKAIPLSITHKASDPSEQKRIRDLGGLIIGKRICGALAGKLFSWNSSPGTFHSSPINFLLTPKNIARTHEP